MFDSFDFFQQEGSDNAGFDATSTEHSTIGSGDSFLSLGDFLISIRPELGDTVDSLSAVATIMGSARSMCSLLNVLHDDFGAGCSDFSNFIGLGIVAESASVCNSLHHGCMW